MGHAIYDQTNFLGGEWGKFMQGRSDHKNYRSAMNLCYNGMPVEQGAWVRRPGTRVLSPTFKGKPALIRPVWFTEAAPYEAEFTDGFLRFFWSAYPVITPEEHGVVSVSAANPAILTISDAATWATGDEIAILAANGADATQARLLRQRSFTVTPQAFTPAAWDSTFKYGVGSYVSKLGINYQSLQANNLNQDPATQVAWWQVVTGTNKFKLTDTLTGVDVNGTLPGQSLTSTIMVEYEAIKILRLPTPYSTGSWSSIRLAQNQDVCLAMNGTTLPQAFYIEPNSGTPEAATAAINPVAFQDGPYLDAIPGSIATVGGLSGSVTVTVTFGAWSAATTYAKGDWVTSGASAYKSLIDGNLNNLVSVTSAWEAHDKGAAVTGDNTDTIGFQATDVGRLMRFFNAPAAWVSTATYSTGNIVYFNNQAYQASQGVGANVPPDANPTFWTLLPSGQTWSWGRITSVTSTNSAQILILGPALLYNQPCTLWRLGVYSDTTGYPTCGIFYKGRFWFGGAKPNRFDTSRSNGVDRDGIVRMSPTEYDGTVTDTCGISYTFTADDKNDIMWFMPDQHGLIAGTAGGEWLIAASNLNDPITPTSIDANRVTKYRCANIEPKKTPMATVFVQAFKKKVLEFIADVFTGRYTAPHLSETAKHLTNQGIEEMGYQEETSPTLWFRTTTSKLIGATYRRVSAFASEAPAFIGWHQHALGHGRPIECLAVGPTINGSMDTAALVTSDGTYRYVESMTQLFDETDVIWDAWFLDGAYIPDQMIEETVGGQLGLTFTGLYYFVGKTVTVFAGALDLGEYTVAADGTIHIPYGSGIAPALIDYTTSGWGLPFFTHDYVFYVLSLNLTLKNGGVKFVLNTTIVSTVVIANPNGVGTKFQTYLPTAGYTGMATPDWNNSLLWMPTNDQTQVSTMNLGTGVLASNATVATATGTVGDGCTKDIPLAIDNEGNASWPWGASNYDPIICLTKNLILKYRAGAASTFGPPNTNGATGSAPTIAIEANSPWLVNAGTGGIMIFSDTDGHFVAGNGSTDVAYMGINQTPWTLEGFTNSSTSCAKGRPGVVNGYFSAMGYFCQKGTDWPNDFSMFVVGVTDGAPGGGAVAQDNGSTGKKGKGKKHASSGSVFHTPTAQNPLVGLEKIGELAATSVDSRWLHYGSISGSAVDQSDNSIIIGVNTDTTGRAAWSGATTYANGDIVSQGGHLYQSVQAGNLNHDPAAGLSGLAFPAVGTWWKEVPTSYIVKYRTGQFSGMSGVIQGLHWVVPVIQNNAGVIQWGSLFSTSRIQGGLIGFVQQIGNGAANSGRVYLIDTTNGKFFAGLIPGLTLNGDQSWDDQSVSVVFEGAILTTQPGAPVGLNGSTSTGYPQTQWTRLYIGTGIPADPTIISTLSLQPSAYQFIYNAAGSSGGFPVVVGYNYTSMGQIVRAIAPQETGSRTGPAFGALRSSKTLAALLQSSLGLEFGTDFTKMVKSSLKDRESGKQPQPVMPVLNGSAYTITNAGVPQMFSGIFRDALEGKTDFDAMVAWRVNRPVPAAVVALGPNVNVEDR